MSYRSLLKHRCTLYELDSVVRDGQVFTEWSPVKEGLRCFVDLNFIRRGKDPFWTPEAGRPSDRTGVAFFMPDAPVKSGMRVRVTQGPACLLTIEGAVDEVWRLNKLHHLEVGVQEVAASMYRPNRSEVVGG